MPNLLPLLLAGALGATVALFVVAWLDARADELAPHDGERP